MSDARDETITIVSGLPRSGTSMMMKMLDAGGLPALTDEIREADEDNPRGYYEFEPVKKTKKDSSWLESAGGKVVKMVHLLLLDLPTDRSYRVIFMRRAMNEILVSQRRMLERQGHPPEQTDEEMGELFTRHLTSMEQWLKQQSHIDVLYINYKDVIENPSQEAELVNQFVGNTLNVKKMAAVVDESLYRNKEESMS